MRTSHQGLPSVFEVLNAGGIHSGFNVTCRALSSKGGDHEVRLSNDGKIPTLHHYLVVHLEATCRLIACACICACAGARSEEGEEDDEI